MENQRIGILWLVCPALLVAVSAAFSQQTPRPSFEVVSVKPANPNDPVFGMRIEPGRFSISNATLEMLVGFAYSIPNAQLSAGPRWVDSDGFTIEAKVDDSTPLTPGNAGIGQMALMLQSILSERFNLSVHKDTKEAPVYVLVPAKGGSKIQRAEDSATAGRRIGRGQLTGTMPIPVLAVSLSQWLDRPVVDRTGLKGNYVVSLTYTPELSQGARFAPPGPDAPPADTNAPSIFRAVQEQLGLELKSSREPVEILVIDRAEKPSEN